MSYKDREQQLAYQRKHYRRNKEHYLESKECRRAELREWLHSQKTPCSKCGESHLACLEFHHLDPSKKEIGISATISRGWSKKRILREMAKCIILCANCHRKLHWSA